jgi:excisionase family DNA binding protein
VRHLTQYDMSVTEAAAALGISRATAYRRIAHYGIRVPRS